MSWPGIRPKITMRLKCATTQLRDFSGERMAVLVDILLPPEVDEAAESIVERWLYKVGERVRANEPLLEIKTDKAVVEVPSPADGVLHEILKQANDAVRPGDVLGRIDT